jgi:predicted nucleotidyltransferase
VDLKALKDELVTIATRLEGVRLVYLFGSRVAGDLGPMSDYDLALLVDRAVDGRPVQARLAHELAHALQTDRVDVLLLNRAPVELAYAVIAQGALLYEQDVATRVEYEAMVLGRYGDLLPMLRAQRADILRGDDHDRRVRRYRAALGRTERTLGQIAATHRQSSD